MFNRFESQLKVQNQPVNVKRTDKKDKVLRRVRGQCRKSKRISNE